MSFSQAILSLQGSLDSVLNDLQGVTVIMKRAITEVSVIATRLELERSVYKHGYHGVGRPGCFIDIALAFPRLHFKLC